MPVPPGPLDGLDFRRLSARGTYLHDAAFAFGLSASTVEPGARLVTPLRLDDGRIILVDRGWLPQPLLPPNVPPDLQPGGLGRGRGHRPLARRHRAAAGWPRPITRAGGAGSPGTSRRSSRRWASSSCRSSWSWSAPRGRPACPKAERVETEFPNNHLGYALTWYGLAAALLVIYILFSSTRPDAPAP